MAETSHGTTPAGRGHEERDLNVRAVGLFLVGLLLTVGAALLVVGWLFDYFTVRQARLDVPPSRLAEARPMPPEPRLQVAPLEDLKATRAAEDAALIGYGWVDRKAGIAKIPINRAMELLAERGLPAGGKEVSTGSSKRTGPPNAEAAQPQGPETAVELLMPIMRPERGRKLFASKGCVVCHSINGVGGRDAPRLDASTMAGPMNPFDFAAKMWRGAPTMIAMQDKELGYQITFTGQELADIIAFAHDPAEQRKLSKADIPPNIRKIMKRGD